MERKFLGYLFFILIIFCGLFAWFYQANALLLENITYKVQGSGKNVSTIFSGKVSDLITGKKYTVFLDLLLSNNSKLRIGPKIISSNGNFSIALPINVKRNYQLQAFAIGDNGLEVVGKPGIQTPTADQKPTTQNQEETCYREIVIHQGQNSNIKQTHFYWTQVPTELAGHNTLAGAQLWVNNVYKYQQSKGNWKSYSQCGENAFFELCCYSSKDTTENVIIYQNKDSQAYWPVKVDIGGSVKFFTLLSESQNYLNSQIFPKFNIGKQCVPTTTFPPLNVGLVIDNSGSMGYAASGQEFKISAAKRLASNFVLNTLQAQDKVAITGVSDAQTYQTLTANKQLAANAISALIAKKDTKLHDAIIASVLQLAKEPKVKRIVIALTDGNENDSAVKNESVVINYAKQNGIKVYIIGLGSKKASQSFQGEVINEAKLKNIAKTTGGKYYSLENVDDLKNIYDSVVQAEKTSGNYLKACPNSYVPPTTPVAIPPSEEIVPPPITTIPTVGAWGEIAITRNVIVDKCSKIGKVEIKIECKDKNNKSATCDKFEFFDQLPSLKTYLDIANFDQASLSDSKNCKIVASVLNCNYPANTLAVGKSIIVSYNINFNNFGSNQPTNDILNSSYSYQGGSSPLLGQNVDVTECNAVFSAKRTITSPICKKAHVVLEISCNGQDGYKCPEAQINNYLGLGSPKITGINYVSGSLKSYSQKELSDSSNNFIETINKGEMSAGDIRTIEYDVTFENKFNAGGLKYYFIQPSDIYISINKISRNNNGTITAQSPINIGDNSGNVMVSGCSIPAANSLIAPIIIRNVSSDNCQQVKVSWQITCAKGGSTDSSIQAYCSDISVFDYLPTGYAFDNTKQTFSSSLFANISVAGNLAQIKIPNLKLKVGENVFVNYYLSSTDGGSVSAFSDSSYALHGINKVEITRKPLSINVEKCSPPGTKLKVIRSTDLITCNSARTRIEATCLNSSGCSKIFILDKLEIGKYVRGQVSASANAVKNVYEKSISLSIDKLSYGQSGFVEFDIDLSESGFPGTLLDINKTNLEIYQTDALKLSDMFIYKPANQVRINQCPAVQASREIVPSCDKLGNRVAKVTITFQCQGSSSDQDVCQPFSFIDNLNDFVTASNVKSSALFNSLKISGAQIVGTLNPSFKMHPQDSFQVSYDVLLQKGFDTSKNSGLATINKPSYLFYSGLLLSQESIPVKEAKFSSCGLSLSYLYDAYCIPVKNIPDQKNFVFIIDSTSKDKVNFVKNSLSEFFNTGYRLEIAGTGQLSGQTMFYHDKDFVRLMSLDENPWWLTGKNTFANRFSIADEINNKYRFTLSSGKNITQALSMANSYLSDTSLSDASLLSGIIRKKNIILITDSDNNVLSDGKVCSSNDWACLATASTQLSQVVKDLKSKGVAISVINLGNARTISQIATKQTAGNLYDSFTYSANDQTSLLAAIGKAYTNFHVFVRDSGCKDWTITINLPPNTQVTPTGMQPYSIDKNKAVFKYSGKVPLFNVFPDKVKLNVKWSDPGITSDQMLDQIMKGTNILTLPYMPSGTILTN